MSNVIGTRIIQLYTAGNIAAQIVLFHVGPARTQPDRRPPPPLWRLKGGMIQKGVKQWRSACYQSWVSSLVSVLDSRLSFRLLLWSGGSSGTWARGSERIRYLSERETKSRWEALISITCEDFSHVGAISRTAPSSRTPNCRFHTLRATKVTQELNKQVNCAMHSPLSTATRTQPSPWILMGASLAQLLCWKSCFSLSAYYFFFSKQHNAKVSGSLLHSSIMWLFIFCSSRHSATFSEGRRFAKKWSAEVGRTLTFPMSDL